MKNMKIAITVVIWSTIYFVKIAHGSESINKTYEERHPNFIVLLVDDLGYGDLGISGHPTSRTPNIDKLARNSRYFNHFYVSSPICSPSRSSILTGRYQMRSGTYPGTYTPSSILGLPTNETTIAKLLKNEGYRTQIVGKWHLGVGKKRQFLPSNPKFGFDDFFGLPYSHDMCACSICYPKNHSCYDSCWSEKEYVSCPLFHNEKIIQQPVYLPDLSQRLLNRAIEFINSTMRDKRPFFLYYSFHHVHHPQFSSSKFYDRSHRGWMGDSLLELDWAVGVLYRALKSMKQLDNTLIWFTSDNGPSLQRHERGGCASLLRCGKGTTWEGGVKVPSFVHWKGKIKPGRSDKLTSALDILPTLCSIADVNTTHLNLDGHDQSHLLLSNAKNSIRKEQKKLVPKNRDFVALYPVNPKIEVGPFSVVFKNFKAHFYTQGSDLSDAENFDPMCSSTHRFTKHSPPLLYDLYLDPGERYDLSNSAEHQGVLKIINDWRIQHKRNMTWMAPRTQIYDSRSQPCCTTSNCEPFPKCCDCVVSAFHK